LKQQMQHDFDVIIVGGGLVGAACAIALARQGQQVALLDSKPLSSPAKEGSVEDWDNRIYAISPGNAAWLATLGVWDMLDSNRVCPIENMEVWGDASTEPLQLKAYEANVAQLGFVLENRPLQRALWTGMKKAGVEVFADAHCMAMDTSEQNARLELSTKDFLTAKLVVAADGSNSWIRSQAHIPTQTYDYEQVAVVANFETELSHHNCARQWFSKEGILAWLPLPGKRISMVWSTSNEKADKLLGLEADALAAEVSKAGMQALGNLNLITPAAAFPLRLQTAKNMIAPRLAIVGDAAHQIHPLAGQGVNLGFRDVISLALTLKEKHHYQDMGDLTLLRRYERARRTDMLAIKFVTHGLQKLFENEQSTVRKMRNWGLRFTNNQPALKKLLIKQAVI
jgi:ubiquinone biosynthesis UbiH/UbiF/VisC/COQ6 family hydroxylase